MALLDRISDANRQFEGRDYYRYIVNGDAVGWIDTQLLAELSPDLFTIRAPKKQVHSNFLAHERTDFEQRMAAFFRDYFAKHGLTGWRDERYGVRTRFSQPPQFLTERATLSFLGVTGYGVHVNGYVEINYDLRLPDDFVPVVNDGEVDSFQLIECRELLERIAETQEMKFNSALVVIDFAIRHAIITPEHPDYVELCSGMHSVKRRAVRAI